jgi:hypothetical protein
MMKRGERFLARIDIERSIIGIVNSSEVGGNFPLAGLSEGAIREWRRRVAVALPRNVVNAVGVILEDASRRTGLMADNSRIVFDPEFKTDSAALEALRCELIRLLPFEGSRRGKDAIDTSSASSA